MILLLTLLVISSYIPQEQYHDSPETGENGGEPQLTWPPSTPALRLHRSNGRRHGRCGDYEAATLSRLKRRRVTVVRRRCTWKNHEKPRMKCKIAMVDVGKTMPFLPPMTGNAKHTTYKNGDDWGMVYGVVLPTLFMEYSWNF